MVQNSPLAELIRDSSARTSTPVSTDGLQVCTLLSSKKKQAYFVREGDCDWMVYLFRETSQNCLKFAADEYRKCSNPESQLTSLHENASTCTASPRASQVFEGSQLIHCSNQETAVCVPCISLHSAAVLMANHGPPPHVVSLDWKWQCGEIAKLQNCEIDLVETFVSEDGVLIPIGFVLDRWASQHALLPFGDSDGDNASSSLVAWPWQACDAITTPMSKPMEGPSEQTIWPFESTRPSTRTKPSELGRANRQRLAVIGIAATAAAFLLIGMFFPWQTKNDRETAFATAGEKASLETFSEESALNAEQPPGELTTLEIVTTGHTEIEIESETNTVESLLSQLGQSGSQKFTLHSNSIDTLISDSFGLTKNRTFMSEDASPELLNADTVPAVDGAVADESADVGATLRLTDDSPLIKRVIRLASAVYRDRISVGPNIATSQCLCEIEIGIHPKLVIEPKERMVWKGASDGKWRIAIEDEEPELMVEVQSKPASRWQLNLSVALKETANSPPIPIGPNDAVLVSKRLLEYHRWLGSTISILQTAKLNRPSRSRIDYVGEIKRAEKQQREVEKAIERWKTVEKLAVLFFAEHEIRVTLHANLKN